MFFLSLLEHTLRLPPDLLRKALDQAIKGELETLFLDKVIPNLGLCVSVYDLRSIDGGFIFPGDGASTFTVTFRLIMFRPYVGEILSGEVEESDANGLRLSLGFFKDIMIPVHHLPYISKFEDGRWMWDFEGTELFIEKEEEIRFRVHSISYPPIPVEQEKDAKPFAPMVITVSGTTGFRLGLLHAIDLLLFAKNSIHGNSEHRLTDAQASIVSEGGLGPISWWV